jgi:hypothetical protein
MSILSNSYSKFSGGDKGDYAKAMARSGVSKKFNPEEGQQKAFYAKLREKWSSANSGLSFEDWLKKETASWVLLPKE